MPNETMQQIIKKYPWIKEEKQKLIISPDSDGFLSALLFINYFGAKVVGYYDCKIMLCDKNIDPRDCTFVDLDIFCKDIKSVGHHMVCYNKDKKPNNWYHYDNCIQLNNLRNFDCKNSFKRKYPFATIHFLLSLLETVKHIEIAPDAIGPLLFSDGVCNNLFGYPENCLDWLQWLGANSEDSILYKVFYTGTPFSKIMENINDFFEFRDKYNSTCYYDFNEKRLIKRKSPVSRSGHHMLISNKEGTPVNIIENADNSYNILEEEQKRILGFIDMMAKFMGWKTLPEKWNFSNLKLYKFKKENMKQNIPLHLNLGNYNKMAEGDCFSMAITAGTTIEYTRDTEGHFRR